MSDYMAAKMDDQITAAIIANEESGSTLVERLRELCERHKGVTPGPWRWVWSEQAKRVVIQGGKTTYDLTVVDFVRYGMSQAAPRFREDVDCMNIMHRADHWGTVVSGREHHASWFKSLDHPDANLIADAPTLLAAIREAAAEIERLRADALVKVAPLPTTIDKAWAEPVIALVRASLAVVRDMQKQHDERSSPHKYTAPFGAIATLSEVLEKHFSETCTAIDAARASVKGST